MSLPLLVGAEIPSCHAERSEASGRRKRSGRRINSRPRSFAVAQDDRTERREQITVLYPLFYLRAALVVQTRELAEQLYRHIIVRNRGIFLVVIMTDMNQAVLITYLSHPFAFFLTPVNALISTCAVAVRQAIVLVL